GQARLAAAEQHGKELAEMAVDGIEGLLQQLAGLAVDLADRALEGVDGRQQVALLGVEKALALARGAELVERRQVDRPQGFELARNPLDLGLQPADARPLGRLRVDMAAQGRTIDLAGIELFGVLFDRQARGLFLELQFRDAGAQRVQRRLRRRAALVGVAQAPGQFVLAQARQPQGLFACGARLERILQAGLRRGLVQFEQLTLQGFEFGPRAPGLLGGQLQGPVQFVEAVSQAARRVPGLLGGALALADLVAQLLGAPGQFLGLEVDLGVQLLLSREGFVQLLEAGLGLVAPARRLGLLAGDLVQVAADAPRVLVGLRRLLRQAVMLDLGLVQGAHQFGDALARRAQRLRHLATGRIGTR